MSRWLGLAQRPTIETPRGAQPARTLRSHICKGLLPMLSGEGKRLRGEGERKKRARWHARERKAAALQAQAAAVPVAVVMRRHGGGRGREKWDRMGGGAEG